MDPERYQQALHLALNLTTDLADQALPGEAILAEALIAAQLRLESLLARVEVIPSDVKGMEIVDVQVLVERAGLYRIRETFTWETEKYGARVKLNYGLDRAINQLAFATSQAPLDVLAQARAEAGLRISKRPGPTA